MPSKTRRAPASRTVGPNIVRAWFDVVINPLLYGLAAEQKVLTRENWTWSYERKRLRSVVPVQEHVVFEGWDMLEQFLKYRPECRSSIAEHDQRVDALSTACQAFHQTLTKSPAMREAFERAAAEFGTRPYGSLTDIFGAAPAERYLDVLAEYVVNSVDSLPHNYSTASFWNAHKDEFFRARLSDDVRPHWEATREAGAQTLHTVRNLSSVFKNARNELSLEHDVPFVRQVLPVEPVRV